MIESEDLLITSRSNRFVRLIRSLQRRAGRLQERAFVVEGERAVFDAMATGTMPSLIVLREGWHPTSDPFARVLAGVPARSIKVVESSLFSALSDTVSPSGIISVFPFPRPAVSEKVELIVIADGLRDPGNLGSLIRAAAGAGATEVLTTSETVDPFNPKSVRAGMGAHFRIPVRPYRDADHHELAARCGTRVLAEGGSHPPPEAIDWTEPALLIIGGEAFGARASAIELANHRVSIPLQSGIESLNAAVAGAVVLFEAARQRHRGERAGGTGVIRHSSY